MTIIEHNKTTCLIMLDNSHHYAPSSFYLTAMVNNALNRISHWLAAHAPRILSNSPNPGASEAQLATLEATIGQHLPADYRVLYLHHNGLNEDVENFGNFFYGMSFLPLAEVGAIWQRRAKAAAPAPVRWSRAITFLNPMPWRMATNTYLPTLISTSLIG